MILAAGLGTRLQHLTKDHPKALVEINHQSLLERNIRYLQTFGIREIIVNVHHFPDQIIRSVEANRGWGSNVVISDERDALLETGGGLIKASWFFEKESFFLLMNADILTDLNLDVMMESHLRNQPLATLATTERVSSRYFLFNGNNELSGWKNEKTGEIKIARSSPVLTPRAFSGIHLIQTTLFGLITRTGRFSIVDLYLDLAGQQVIQSFDHSGSKLIDVGRPENIPLAEEMFPA